MSTPNIFEQLSKLTRTTKKIALCMGDLVYDEITGSTQAQPAEDAERIVFEIHSITPNEEILAEAMMTEKPPAKIEDHPSPKGVGMIRVHVGWDEEDPEYVRKLQAQLPMRNAMICLMGCPALRDTTPGGTPQEKARHICDNLPSPLVHLLSLHIERLCLYNRVGNEEVERFLEEGSASKVSTSSKNSGERSPARKKSKPTKSSTAPTSPTKSTKQPKPEA